MKRAAESSQDNSQKHPQFRNADPSATTTSSQNNPPKRTQFRTAEPSVTAARNHGKTDVMIRRRTTSGRPAVNHTEVESSKSTPPDKSQDQNHKSTPQVTCPPDINESTPSDPATPQLNTHTENLEDEQPKKRSRTWANNIVCKAVPYNIDIRYHDDSG